MMIHDISSCYMLLHLAINTKKYISIILSLSLSVFMYIHFMQVLESDNLGAYIHRARNAWES